MNGVNRLLAHMLWADTRVLEGLRSAADPTPALALFAHLLAAERVWLARLRGEDTLGLEIWPRLSLEECVAYSEGVRAELAAYTDRLGADALEGPVSYRNSSGREFTSRVGDILTHLAMHGAYHRGQIAVRLRDAGSAPVNTDFITFVRELPEPPPPAAR
jgi:uncharacterized damage-inducible protein DinB